MERERERERNEMREGGRERVCACAREGGIERGGAKT